MIISLVIPVYNNEKCLQRLFDSISSQKFDDYEVIIIDDNSTDNSVKLIEKYANDNPRVKVIRQKQNLGPGIARKVGFERSTGDLVIFIDSDDRLENEKVLSNFANIYLNSHFDILFFNTLQIYKSGDKIVNCLYDLLLSEGLHSVDELKERKVGSALWYKVFVRKKMKSEFFINANNLEDCHVTYCYLNNCKTFYYYPGVCYVADRSREDSLSKQNQLKKIPESVRVLRSTYSATNYKRSLFYTIADYYTAMRRLVAKSKLSKEKKKDLIKTLLKLKHIIKKDKRELIRTNWKIIAKYYYYSLGDFRYEK